MIAAVFGWPPSEINALSPDDLAMWASVAEARRPKKTTRR